MNISKVKGKKHYSRVLKIKILQQSQAPKTMLIKNGWKVIYSFTSGTLFYFFFEHSHLWNWKSLKNTAVSFRMFPLHYDLTQASTGNAYVPPFVFISRAVFQSMLAAIFFSAIGTFISCAHLRLLHVWSLSLLWPAQSMKIPTSSSWLNSRVSKMDDETTQQVF